jgi:enoyl-[acyl-carrier-protein] reductase (NADH)
MGFLQGKRVLIFGVASNRSIAWGIARAMQREGAELAFAYQGERLKERVEKTLILLCPAMSKTMSKSKRFSIIWMTTGTAWTS